MSYLIKYGRVFDFLFPNRIWRMPDDKVYLTFDDGPTRTLTVEILKILEDRKIRATFFCVGSNLNKHDDIVSEIVDKGHVIANHTHRHLNARKASVSEYVKDLEECSEALKSIKISNDLFRPPHGRLTSSIARSIQGKYRVVMWSFLSGDFDNKRTSDQIISSASRVKKGDIIVFHDNEKFSNKVLNSLPAFLDQLKGQNFTFGTL